MNRQMSEIIRKRPPVMLPPETTVREACKRMQELGIGAILVTDPAGKLIGIFTGRDAVRMLAEGNGPRSTRLSAAMTRGPDTLPPGCTAIEALRLMHDGGFRHIPIVDDGVVVGIVSRGDFRGLEQDRLDEETGIWERIG